MLKTGAVSLDLALGGGLRKGSFTEILGEPGSGKLSLLYNIIAENNKTCVLFDGDNFFDPEAAQGHGIDLDKLIVTQEIRNIFEYLEYIIRGQEIEMVCINSIPSIIPETEKDYNEFINKNFSRLLNFSKGLDFIVTNQIRVKIRETYDSLTYPADKALRNFIDYRIFLTQKSPFRDSYENIGNIVEARVRRNKFFPPNQTAKYKLIWGKGVYREDCLLETALSTGVIIKEGTRKYLYRGKEIGNSREEVLDKLQLIYKEVENNLTGGTYV